MTVQFMTVQILTIQILTVQIKTGNHYGQWVAFPKKIGPGTPVTLFLPKIE